MEHVGPPVHEVHTHARVFDFPDIGKKLDFGFGVKRLPNAACLPRHLDGKDGGIRVLTGRRIFYHTRGLDVAVAHALRVVVIRVGNEGLVFHEAQHLVPVPFRTVRDDGLDALFHIAPVLVEQVFKNPHRTGDDIEKQAFEAYLAEMRGKGRASFKPVGAGHVGIAHEVGRHAVFDFCDCTCHCLIFNLLQNLFQYP